LGGSVQDYEKFLRFFRKSFTCLLLVYPGNHNLWVRRFSDSKKLWFEELPKITKDSGYTWPAVHTIIAATHFPILEEQIHRDVHKSGWAFSNAYAGNLTLGKQVLKIKKFSQVLSGLLILGKRVQ